MKYLFSLLIAFTPTLIFAQDSATTAGPGMESLVFQLGIIFVIFYFLLIRPQQKKFKNHIALVASLKKGDKVVTAGGFIGVVTKSTEGEKTVEVEIADGVVVKAIRSTITELAEPKEVEAKPVKEKKKQIKKEEK